MPHARFRLVVALYGVLRDADWVLLLRRAGSGYRDGQLSLPAGHLDGNEDVVAGLVRELREELTIDADRDSCRLVLVMHRPPESSDDHEYLDLFFTVGAWAGTPAIGEPDKCGELVWAGIRTPPADTVDYVRAALGEIVEGKRTLLPYGWSAPPGEQPA